MAKIRNDFVTNSSSSSFIITNTSGKTMTSKEMAMKWFEGIIEDADDRFILEPGQKLIIECGDHPSDIKLDNWVVAARECSNEGDEFDVAVYEMSAITTEHFKMAASW